MSFMDWHAKRAVSTVWHPEVHSTAVQPERVGSRLNASVASAGLLPSRGRLTLLDDDVSAPRYLNESQLLGNS